MKNILLVFLIFIATSAGAQKNSCLITMDGIGPFKIGMRQAEVEKLAGQKLVLKNARDTAVSYNDTAMVTYKSSGFLLFFQRQYTGENIFYMYVIGMKTSSAVCKTAEGIGLGANKSRIIAAYKNNYIGMGPQCEDEDCMKKSKTHYNIAVSSDDYARKIIFSLVNNEVVAIEVATVFNDEE